MDESGKYAYIWTHKKFEIGYNDNRIIDVNLTSESKTQIQPNAKLMFSYEIVWRPTNIKFANRFDKYLDPGFFQHKVKKKQISKINLIYLFRFIGFQYLIRL
jgi:transmembrane 9 superfamily protein 3